MIPFMKKSIVYPRNWLIANPYWCDCDVKLVDVVAVADVGVDVETLTADC